MSYSSKHIFNVMKVLCAVGFKKTDIPGTEIEKKTIGGASAAITPDFESRAIEEKTGDIPK